MALLSAIRRWHLRQHIPIREIDRRTGLSRTQFKPQHFLYFLPEPHGHGSSHPTLGFGVEKDDMGIWAGP